MGYAAVCSFLRAGERSARGLAGGMRAGLLNHGVRKQDLRESGAPCAAGRDWAGRVGVGRQVVQGEAAATGAVARTAAAQFPPCGCRRCRALAPVLAPGFAAYADVPLPWLAQRAGEPSHGFAHGRRKSRGTLRRAGSPRSRATPHLPEARSDRTALCVPS